MVRFHRNNFESHRHNQHDQSYRPYPSRAWKTDTTAKYHRNCVLRDQAALSWDRPPDLTKARPQLIVANSYYLSKEPTRTSFSRQRPYHQDNSCKDSYLEGTDFVRSHCRSNGHDTQIERKEEFVLLDRGGDVSSQRSNTSRRGSGRDGSTRRARTTGAFATEHVDQAPGKTETSHEGIEYVRDRSISPMRPGGNAAYPQVGYRGGRYRHALPSGAGKFERSSPSSHASSVRPLRKSLYGKYSSPRGFLNKRRDPMADQTRADVPLMYLSVEKLGVTQTFLDNASECAEERYGISGGMSPADIAAAVDELPEKSQFDHVKIFVFPCNLSHSLHNVLFSRAKARHIEVHWSEHDYKKYPYIMNGYAHLPVHPKALARRLYSNDKVQVQVQEAPGEKAERDTTEVAVKHEPGFASAG